ncbi:MAG: GntR family transcriptional regulator [Desulfobacterales bacterium]|nr:GntR family transcriptional regulator [Desulfobacterales bacterium]
MEKNNEEIVYQKLKNAIIKRYIKQGTKLVETALAKQLKVSRTPIRAAIRRLAYEGFATYEQNKGVCVIEPTEEEIKETFFVRQQLEGAAAGLAAANIKTKQIDRLEKYLAEELQIFEARDIEEYYRVNDAIHLTIARASDNKVLIRYIEELLNRTKIYLILYDPFYTMPFNPSHHEHRQVVDALKTHDTAKAEKVMSIHLKSAFHGMEWKTLPEDYISL